MQARIIGQNHTVTSYTVNGGKKRYIIEDIPRTNNREIVNLAIAKLNSRRKEHIYCYLFLQGGLPDTALEMEIARMTY